MKSFKGLAVDEQDGGARPALMLAIIRAREGWTILSRNGSWGRYAHWVDAEEAAIRLRTSVGAQGGAVQVLVQSCAGELEPLADTRVSVAG